MNRSAYSMLGATFVASITSGAAEAAEGGMPQLNFHDFAPQLLWMMIAFLQAYVFAILTCLYLNDAIHLSH